MAETEVESILREIRERVLAQQRAGKDASATRSPMTNGGNGAGESLQIKDNDQSPTAENLLLINSYLTTTARAWDRLPPVVSNRSGLIARVERWLKRQSKRATRWYAWEQVNFNAAVHHALSETLPVLLAYDAELQKLGAQLAEAEAQKTQLEHELREHVNQLEAQVTGLVKELRERDAHLQDEQRVCFKQLALETSEAAVLEDRARRKTEAFLAELQHRIEQIEKSKK